MADSRSSEQAASVPERLKGDPFFMTFGLPWPPLAQSSEQDLGLTFERVGQRLGPSERRARVHFGINDGNQMRSWSLELGPEGCAVRAERTDSPDLEVLVDDETWWQLVRGGLSPLEAFGGGSMQVIGDLAVARRIAGGLQRSS
jgi:hypothetical protein